MKCVWSNTTVVVAWGSALALLAACSSSDPKAGDNVTKSTPPLPAGCDDALPGVDLEPRRADVESFISSDVAGIRAVGDTVYYLSRRSVGDGGGRGGVFAVEVPGDTPRLIVPNPDGVTFQEIWVDDATIFAVAKGALYAAPRAGGAATLIPGAAADPTFGYGSDPAYARMGDFIYYAPGGTAGLRRVPVAGGATEQVATLRDGTVPHCFVPGATSLYFNHVFEVMRVDGGGLADDPVWTGGLILGESDGQYVTNYCPGIGGYCLNRVDFGSKREPVAIGLPEGVSLTAEGSSASGWGMNSHPVLVTYRGEGYFVARGDYQLPDDRNVVSQPVLLRVRRGSSTADLVRCIPPPPFDSRLPASAQGAEVDDIVASDAGVFVLRKRAMGVPGDLSGRAIKSIRTDPAVIKVWP